MRQRLAREPFAEKNPQSRTAHPAGENFSASHRQEPPGSFFREMTITEDDRKYAAEQGIARGRGAQKGMEEKSRESTEKPGEAAERACEN